jgi:DNA-binding transcriptional MocR family regulator
MNPPYDLAVNYPLRSAVARRLTDALGRTTVDTEALGYPDPHGAAPVRGAIARWMHRTGGHDAIDPDHLVVTLGARHALWLALACLAGGEEAPTVMVDALTYHGFRDLAAGMGVRCLDIAMDGQGMLPASLDAVAGQSGSRIVYVQPTLHNPTTLTLPLQRRRDIATVAERRGLWIIEGDVYSHLVHGTGETLPAFTTLVPGRTLHAGGVGKLLGPGLRVGWLRVPGAGQRAACVERLRRATDGLPGLLPALVAGWMQDGTALALSQDLQAAMRERGALARRIVGLDLVTSNASLHAWLPCADAEALGERLLARGVKVGNPAGYGDPSRRAAGVRLCLGAEEDVGRLEAALGLVAGCR